MKVHYYVLSFVLCVVLIAHDVQSLNEDYSNSNAKQMADGLHALLYELGSPVRITVLVCWRLGNLKLLKSKTNTQLRCLEFRYSMLRAFHSSKIGNRQYLMGIYDENYDYLPFQVQDEHHEMIVMDVNCIGNMYQLIEQASLN